MAVLGDGSVCASAIVNGGPFGVGHIDGFHSELDSVMSDLSMSSSTSASPCRSHTCEVDSTDNEPAIGLHDQLRAAAAQVIIDKGLGAFSIREVARRAGVSHAAPGYHFGDSRGLLTALAIEGFETLHREISIAAANENDPKQRLIAIGRAYVRVATTFPAHCEVMFREDLIDVDDAAYADAGLRAFRVLESTIGAIAAKHNPKLPIFDAATLCWTAMQGLVQLQGAVGDDAEAIKDLCLERSVIAGSGLPLPTQSKSPIFTIGSVTFCGSSW